ncbi:MAG TPA: hypothetical protein PK760_06260, partial [Flavobacteriales bacterium]|nr:hypothetical protein [Flavobacteriales bacterium]
MGTRVIGFNSKWAWLALLPFLVFHGCAPDQPAAVTEPEPELPALPPTPSFNADSAYAFVKMQVDFGPRVPGTPAHKACADRMVELLKACGAVVTEQNDMVTVYNGAKVPMRNIIASWNPQVKERVLLLAH